jgi:predicted transcriptional regulator
MRVEPGAVVWMYAKVPKAQIVGYATVVDLHVGSPSSLWRRFSTKVGISKKEFFEYFAESPSAFAMELKKTTRLKTPLSLSALREVESGFQPPQFFKRLSSDAQVFRAMSELI